MDTVYELAVKRIALYSSGLGFFELSGDVSGAGRVELPFDREQMNDVLKSLTVYDPESVSPSASYPNEETEERTLGSLRVDLRGEPTLERILSGLRGERVEIKAPLWFAARGIPPVKAAGEIVGVQTRAGTDNGARFEESVLTLFCEGQLAQVPIREIESCRFCDPDVTAALADALRFLSEAGAGEQRVLKVCLDGAKPREVRVSFVIAAPVWKANYRLDLRGEAPFLQGWAVVDNASDTDWNDVDLSLVVGRPVSFVQPYYAPLFLSRPEIPLSIAGFAQAQTYDSGYTAGEINAMDMEERYEEPAAMMEMVMQKRAIARYGENDSNDANFELSGRYETAEAKAAGEHFAYTLKNRITLPRQQSAMVPLAQGTCAARKVVIFNPARGAHPALGVEITNLLGVKLPAGAVTVYDDGLYAGDALLDFLPHDEKRLISYGDDLSVHGVSEQDRNNLVGSVKIVKGVMTILTKIVHKTTYVFKNSSDAAKTLILEHPATADARLVEPENPMEKTAQGYRFEVPLGARAKADFTVTEEGQSVNSIMFLNQPYSAVSAYFRNDAYPAQVRDALRKAESLAGEVSKLQARLDAGARQMAHKAENQDRIRQNLTAVGNGCAQGKAYIEELAATDKEIEALARNMEATEEEAVKAQANYKDYLAGIEA
ncbi:MAG: DUF4139 domain-containing protein [Clostridiales Family XIII bacterium]|jgi:hypothetical protein|nr:DUF4139 domain-containing protein [Clostridiales Family XIII bacterium]